MAELTLDGPLITWSDTALAARLGEGASARPVMAFLGPQPFGPITGNDPREQAVAWMGIDAPGVLPLLDVVQLGRRHAWTYAYVEALGLSRMLGAQGPPTRVAAELVASVADILHGLGSRGLAHPGPAPSDIGVDPSGALHLLGFVSPWPASPVLRDPSAGNAGEACVWRLGMLLAQLLGGSVHAVTAKSAHDAMLRRILIRAIGSSGDVFPERYRNWLTGLLAWDPGQRPALSSIGAGLRDVASSMAGPGLPEWAGTEVYARCGVLMRTSTELEATVDADSSYHPWQSAREASKDQHTSGPPSIYPSPLSAHQTLHGLQLGKIPPDDRAAEVTLLPDGKASVGPKINEPGTMPVRVGPPVEAATKPKPSLPPDFLDRLPQPLEVETDTTGAFLRLLALIMVAVFFATATAIGLLFWRLG
jgi:hypothetical protein